MKRANEVCLTYWPAVTGLCNCQYTSSSPGVVSESELGPLIAVTAGKLPVKGDEKHAIDDALWHSQL